MGKRLAAVVGWGVGGIVALYVLFVAVYPLLAPDCVTDGDLRDARLAMALNAVTSSAALVGAVAVTRWMRGRLAPDDRFVVGPVFAGTILGFYVVVLLLNGFFELFLDVPGPSAACF